MVKWSKWIYKKKIKEDMKKKKNEGKKEKNEEMKEKTGT